MVSLALIFGVAGMLYACADEGTSDMPELTTARRSICSATWARGM